MEQLIEKFVNDLRAVAGSTVTSIQIFVGSSNSEIVINKRTPEELKIAGVSMRNISGEWIK